MYDVIGLRKCAVYGFPPNRLHFCGPEKQNDLLGYLKTSKTDTGLMEILQKFETVYPYLKLIAGASHIKDPFNRRVVEAYWLGNSLLNNIKTREFSSHLSKDLNLRKKIPSNRLNKILSTTESGFPYHTFHVLNIFMRSGRHAVPHTLSTMDNCRISWGEIIKINDLGLKNKEKVSNIYYIKTNKLKMINNQLHLNKKPEIMQILSIGQKYKSGDWVSVHWGYICEKITSLQIKQLKYFTDLAISAFNRQKN